MIKIEEILNHSYNRGLSHIPSALSMLTYLNELFFNEIVTPDDKIILGKPFGSQAYYLIWNRLGYLKSLDNLNIGVKHDEIPFVTFSEETMGNALGVSIGVAISNPNKRVWVNITDASLQMGNTLEAIQFIGQNNLKNIFVTVDYNDAQVTGRTSDIIKVDPCINFCMQYNWNTQVVNGHNSLDIKKSFQNINAYSPNIVFYKTVKGYGVNQMMKDIKKWHYKKIETSKELQLLVEELQVT